MNALAKIKLFRIVLWMTYPVSLILLYPLALLRKKNPGHLFLFFDKYEMGGAPRTHLNILDSIPNLPKQVYFTRTSLTKAYRQEFYNLPGTDVFEISFLCENILLRIFSVHYFAFYINRHDKAHVFSSVSTFFYDMLPFLGKHVVKTELLHMFTNDKKGLEYFGLGGYKYLTHRMVIDKATYENIRKQYEDYNVDSSYMERVGYAETGVEVPASMTKDYNMPLKILYAGRGTPQKRIDRLDKIAQYCIENKMSVEFHFAGNMMDELSDYVKTNSVIHGEISDINEMYALYKKCHVVLMTSAFEGFPMLIKESMAYGCVPVVTALEGNKNHLQNGVNALLIHNLENDEALVKEGIDCLSALINDRHLLEKLSTNAYTYASEHFDIGGFREFYRKFLTGIN